MLGDFHCRSHVALAALGMASSSKINKHRHKQVLRWCSAVAQVSRERVPRRGSWASGSWSDLKKWLAVIFQSIVVVVVVEAVCHGSSISGNSIACSGGLALEVNSVGGS